MPEINQNEKRLKKLRLLNILKTNNYRRNSLRLRNGEAIETAKPSTKLNAEGTETAKRETPKAFKQRSEKLRNSEARNSEGTETAKPSTKLNGEAIKT